MIFLCTTNKYYRKTYYIYEVHILCHAKIKGLVVKCGNDGGGGGAEEEFGVPKSCESFRGGLSSTLVGRGGGGACGFVRIFCKASSFATI